MHSRVTHDTSLGRQSCRPSLEDFRRHYPSLSLCHCAGDRFSYLFLHPSLLSILPVSNVTFWLWKHLVLKGKCPLKRRYRIRTAVHQQRNRDPKLLTQMLFNSCFQPAETKSAQLSESPACSDNVCGCQYLQNAFPGWVSSIRARGSQENQTDFHTLTPCFEPKTSPLITQAVHSRELH